MYKIKISQDKYMKYQDKYVKWTLGLDWCTPGYIIKEETKRQALKIEIGRRALIFKEKIVRKFSKNT